MIDQTCQVRHQAFYWADHDGYRCELVIGVRRLKRGRVRVQVCDYGNHLESVSIFNLFESEEAAVESVVDSIEMEQLRLARQIEELNEVKARFLKEARRTPRKAGRR